MMWIRFMKRRGRFMGKNERYIRRQAVFHKGSERHLKIWEWGVETTNDFTDQSFADWLRDKLEWCMQNERNVVQVMDSEQEQKPIEHETKKGGWSNFV
jgi:hypothetical protein